MHVARTVLEGGDAFSFFLPIVPLDLENAFARVSHDVLFSISKYVNVVLLF